MLGQMFNRLSRLAALPLSCFSFPRDFSLLPKVRSAILDSLQEPQV